MLPNASRSYASSLATKGLKLTPTTSTLFQAKHSSLGTQTSERVRPSSSQSTMPQSSSAFPSRQAPRKYPSATERLSMEPSSKASQPGIVQCIAESDWPACVHPRPGGGDPLESQTSFAPTDSRSQASTPFPQFTSTSNLPSDHHANTNNGEASHSEGASISAIGESLQRLHLGSLNTPPSLEGSQLTLTPEQYAESGPRKSLAWVGWQ